MTPYFFGYGSLVNRQTHTYPDAQPAKLHGWRRAWVRTPERDIVYLTVVQDPSTTIDGLIAAVPDADWDALDEREYGYARHDSEQAVAHNLNPAPNIAHYAIPIAETGVAGDHVILLSYLDVVIQGFLREFGIDGVAQFFATTDGWDTPVLDDRDAPLYPRHQALTSTEISLVDNHLSQLSARIKQRHETAFTAKNF